MENMRNICIGTNAGIHLTDQRYQLCLKCEELGIDLVETMTEREYELIACVVKMLQYYYNKDKVVNSVSTGSCSTQIGYKTLSLQETIPKY